MRKLAVLIGLCAILYSCMFLPGEPSDSSRPIHDENSPSVSYPTEGHSSPAVTQVSNSGFNVPFKSGHLGIHAPLDARKSRRKQADLRDLSSLRGLKKYGVSSMEEYAPWFWLEPQKGKLNWRIFDHNHKGLKNAGMKTALSPFGHFVPDWVTRENDFQGFICREHNKQTTFPSIFAPSTLKYYDRYYSILAKHYKGKVSSIYPAGTSDFGEIGYPHGVDVWDDHHMHEGWWINDPYARVSYSKYLRNKFETISDLNKEWGTQYRAFTSITYPEDSKNRKEWLDFIDWYRSAQIDFVVELVDLSKKYFPGIPIEFKLGQPYEKPIYGIDAAGLFKVGKEHGFTIRSTAAFVPSFVYKKISSTNHPISFFLGVRQATLADFYGLPFVTEEFAGMPKEMSLPRIFNDASFGVDEVFIGPPTLMSALDYYKRFGSFIRGEYATTHTAFYFPLTDHLLKPEQQFPFGLFNASNILRERMNYGVVDDQMVDEGALDRYQYLVMYDLGVMKESILRAIESWVRKGGILVHPFAGERLDVLDGKAAPYESALFRFSKSSQRSFEGSDIYLNKLGKGAVVAIDKPSRISGFYDTVVSVVHRGDQLVPGAMTEPEIDVVEDGVYASAFKDRVLLFNSGKRRVTKTFNLEPKHFPSLSQTKKFTVTLAPLSMQEVMLSKGSAVAGTPAAKPIRSTSQKTTAGTAQRSMSPEDVQKRVQDKVARFQRQMPVWASNGGDPNRVRPLMQEVTQLLNSGDVVQAERKLDVVLSIIEK